MKAAVLECRYLCILLQLFKIKYVQLINICVVVFVVFVHILDVSYK